MAEALTGLPAGFQLDPPQAAPNVPQLPAGFQLDPPQATQPSAQAAPPPAQAGPSTLMDVIKSFGSGIVRGNAELAMLPVTAQRALDKYATPYELDYAVNPIRALFGYDPLKPEDVTGGAVQDAIGGAQDQVRGVMNDALHKPQTTTGEYAGTIGEFVQPGIVKKGLEEGLRAGLSQFAGQAVVPGAASEAAGQLTEGTSMEPWARVAGALAGNTAVVLPQAYNTPETVLRRAAGPADGIDWQRATDLQNNSTGITLTGPEAIAQAQGGASALPDLMRVVEGSLQGKQAMGPLFSARQGQVDTAVTNLLDLIAPQSATPSTIGPTVANAANTAIDNVRKGINDRTRPLYAAAEPTLVPATEFQAVASNPRFQAALERLRANPELSPDYANLPDNSVAVMDAVAKDMFARGEALSTKTNPLYGPELAGKSSEAATAARDVARQASPEYDQALAAQAAARQNELQPLEQGPLGRVAASTTTPQAGEALLPRNPLVGSEGETANAVRRLVAEDPNATPALVRQELADRYAAAAKDTQSGSHETAGIKFRNAIAGSAPQDAVLRAILDNLPSNAAAQAAPELLDVLQATGRRKAIGSATDFNAAIRGDLSVNSPVQRTLDVIRSLGTTAITNAADATKRAAYGRSLGSLADIFADPNSVQLIQDALTKTPSRGFADLLARTGQQAPAAGRDRSGER